MPFYQVKQHDIQLFYCLNSDPRDFMTATEPSHLRSRPFKPDLPTLVLIHSSASSVLNWSRQFKDPRLTNNFNIFAVDCVISGWATVTPAAGKLTFEDSANFVFQLLEEMKFTSYHLLGEAVHGCNIASWITVKAPQKVKSLTLASPGWREEEPEVCASLEAIRESLFINKTGRGGDDSGTLPEEPLSDICAYFIGALPRLADAREHMRVFFQKRYGTSREIYEVDCSFNLVTERVKIPDEKLATLQFPVLILRGGEDNIVSPEKACEEWRRAFVNAPVSSQTIASAPSLLSLSDANVVNRIVSNFCLRAQ
ncbi:hypothetical protein JCM3765_002975 [Sporobolomyces pararoseus]